MIADSALSELRVTRELDRVITEHVRSKMIVSDNSSDFSKAILAWAIHQPEQAPQPLEANSALNRNWVQRHKGAVLA